MRNFVLFPQRWREVAFVIVTEKKKKNVTSRLHAIQDRFSLVRSICCDNYIVHDSHLGDDYIIVRRESELRWVKEMDGQGKRVQMTGENARGCVNGIAGMSKRLGARVIWVITVQLHYLINLGAAASCRDVAAVIVSLVAQSQLLLFNTRGTKSLDLQKSIELTEICTELVTKIPCFVLILFLL